MRSFCSDEWIVVLSRVWAPLYYFKNIYTKYCKTLSKKLKIFVYTTQNVIKKKLLIVVACSKILLWTTLKSLIFHIIILLFPEEAAKN